MQKTKEKTSEQVQKLSDAVEDLKQTIECLKSEILTLDSNNDDEPPIIREMALNIEKRHKRIMQAHSENTKYLSHSYSVIKAITMTLVSFHDQQLQLRVNSLRQDIEDTKEMTQCLLTVLSKSKQTVQ